MMEDRFECEKKQGMSCEESGVADLHYDLTRTWVIDKPAAIQCLKSKRLYGTCSRGAKAATETVDALRSGASAMKAMQKATNISDVDKTMDEINEHIQEALQLQLDALEAELEELERGELEKQLLQPTTTAPLPSVLVLGGHQPAPVLYLKSSGPLLKTNLLHYKLRWPFKFTRRLYSPQRADLYAFVKQDRKNHAALISEIENRVVF
ncbi:unnamed protein product [Arabis nemorensis]|uniref:Uncharacterized protein n=1 Tax=Arabis nemorensis TaxID=586526 RepID=A0A565BTH7_9BRAS|nr:unnamed protein product [Arabis nemorensis]